MMERKMDIACPGTYRKYSTFDGIEEMNVVVRDYVDQLKNMKLRSDVKQSLIKFLKALKTWSCKYVGVSYRTYNNWAETFNVSRKTIERWAEHLEKIGFVQIINSKRVSNMNQTSNIIRIVKPITENEMSLFAMIPGEEHQEEIESEAAQPFEQEMTADNMLSLFAEMPMDQGFEEEVSHKEDKKCLTMITSSSLKQEIKSLYIKERYTKAPSKLLNFVPNSFKKAASILNVADKNIYELWKVVKQVNKRYGLDKEELKEIALDGFNVLKGLLKESYKEGKEKIHNMFGKFNRIMHNLINDYLGNNEDESHPVATEPKRELPFYLKDDWKPERTHAPKQPMSLSDKIRSFVGVKNPEDDLCTIDVEMPY